MIERKALTQLKFLATQFKAIAVVGPRQSGKTTLVKSLFKDKPYISLENPDTKNFALEDPRSFLAQFPNGAILDEVQRAPELFSYLQEILDNTSQKSLFVLTGSNNFLLNEKINQSLAGRIGYLTLLPFTSTELFHQVEDTKNINRLLFTGLYPPIHDQHIEAHLWHENYTKTYIERDVRMIKNISNLMLFEKFMRLLAGRNAQELNANELSVEVGVDQKTIQSWISILQSSYIVYLLKPYYKNFNKTITKRPKLYFYDTGLVCYLLGIAKEEQLALHPLRGAIFESLIVTELLKERLNNGLNNNLYYWREKNKYEVDVLIEEPTEIVALEIKSGKTIHNDYFKNMQYWLNLTKQNKGFILYQGDQTQTRSNGIQVLNWFDYFQNSKL